MAIGAPFFEMEVYADPVAQGRAKTCPVYKRDGNPLTVARTSTRGKRKRILQHVISTTVDPKKSREWKSFIKTLAALRMGELGLPVIPRDVPLALSLECVFGRPRSVKRPCFTIKPDLKNLLAGIEDAMTGAVYEDDSQIVAYFEPFIKRYQLKGEYAHITIRVAQYIPD